MLKVKFLVLFVIVAGMANADTLFNSGPDELTYGPGGLPSICCGYAVTANFNIAAASTVTGIGFSDWLPGNQTPDPVFWAITTEPGLSNVVASGNATALNYQLTATGLEGGNTAYYVTFNVNNLEVSAGTYWLWLAGVPGMASENGWGYASNTGTTDYFFDNGTFRLTESGTQSFEILGAANASAVPEPSSILLLGIALSFLFAVHRKRKTPLLITGSVAS